MCRACHVSRFMVEHQVLQQRSIFPGEPPQWWNISVEGSFSNQNLRTKCSIQTDFCWCNSSLRQQGEPFVKPGVIRSFFLAFTFILAKYPSLDSVTLWHTSLENSVTLPKCLPDVTISVHTTRPVVHQQYNTEQWGGGGGRGGNTATAWNLGSDQNRPECGAVIGT